MLATPVEVKKAYKEGTHKKNYRFVVLNDDGTEDFTIDNDTLVAESVHIDERMATGSELKFGLCEGSSLEFQYFDHPNINGRTVQAFIDIYYDDVNTHSTPMGYFTVKECPRQFSTGIYKATAYNKLQSDYLDANANAEIYRIVDEGEDGVEHGWATLDTILYRLLSGYAIDAVYSLHELPASSNWAKLLLSGGSPEYYAYSVKDESTYIMVPYVRIGIPFNYPITQTNDAYRYWVDCSEIRDHLLEMMGTLKTKQVRNYQNSSDPWLTLEDITFGAGGHEVSIPTIDFNSSHGYPYVPYHVADQEGDYASEYQIERYNSGVMIDVPLAFVYVPGPHVVDYTTIASVPGGTENLAEWVSLLSDTTAFKIEKRASTAFNSMAWDYSDVSALPDVTLRELQSACYEASCQFGQIDRVTNLFYGAELNGGGLYPAETLYPADSLYPNNGTGGQGIHPYPSEYSQLWTDTMGEQSFRYLIITYKTLDENNNEVDAVLQRTVNADGTTDYNMSDNWLFRNLVWTAADVGDYADAMVTKMQGIKWFPFEMWAAGLPYVETGDAIEITDRDGNTHNSYILQRQLQGIQNLQDTYVNGELDIF